MVVEVAAPLPAEVKVRRSDAIYMAHGYLTKVPVAGITPFIEAFTEPGDIVADPFAGSGMTGVAAVVTGRRAHLSDISVLGHHIGSNYVNIVDASALRQAGRQVLGTARDQVQGLYEVPCSRCGQPGELVKATWSQDYACGSCGASFTYYRALEEAGWRNAIRCGYCGTSLQRRNLRSVGETMVLESLASACSRTQVEQSPSGRVPPRFPGLEIWPDLPIGADREMYRRSALAKHALTSTARFFSVRNLTALVALHKAIVAVSDSRIRDKLLFAFTAILPRASKRYQWSRQRPLNAANQTYYVAAVYYEWNVFDLFGRKVEAAIASDDLIRGGPLFAPTVDVTYDIASADDLRHLPDGSVDYIFTDPPFGSNIFYSDMNLFQEAWLGLVTDPAREAVIGTSVGNGSTGERYERILTRALQECARVLKTGGWLSMVFSNSRGEIWGMAQRALKASGLQLVPERLSSIDKGQRSVKGLASGREGVVTSDLVFSARKPRSSVEIVPITTSTEPLADSARAVLEELRGPALSTPSRVYLAVVRRYLERHWDIEPLHFDDLVTALLADGYIIDEESGRLKRVRHNWVDGTVRTPASSGQFPAQAEFQ